MFGIANDGDDLDFRWAGSDGHSVPDERNGQALSQSGAARSTHRVRPGRNARRAGTRHARVPDGAGLPRSVAGTDVVRRGAATGSVHQARRRGDGGSGGADQGEVRSRIDSDRGRAVPHQDRSGARRPDPAGDGRPPARHHRPAHGGRNREAAGDGFRPHARHLRRRHEQDGSGSHLVHHQGSSRQERVHHQHGQAGRGPHQARCRRGHRRSRSRHRDQARAGDSGNRP